MDQEKKDTRWLQRLTNYSKALKQLENVVVLSKERPLTEIEKQGLIHTFKFTHELAWKVMKDYFVYQGTAELLSGSRDATREAFKQGLITNGEEWMRMISSRNQTSHTYNVEAAEEISGFILNNYFKLFRDLETTLITISKNLE